MHYNTVSKLTGAFLLFALATIPVGITKAEALTDSQLLLSQLRGHNTYKNEPQLDINDFEIGRVRGTSGGIMSVEFVEPVTVGDSTYTSINSYGSGMGGDDVLFQVVDDKLVYYGLAKPSWITRLKLKEETDYQNNRAQIWKELEDTREVGLPPLAPENRTYVEAPSEPVVEPPTAQPEPEPIRGMW